MKALMEKSFAAKLSCRLDGARHYVVLSGAPTISQRGWLQPAWDPRTPLVEFRFTYLSKTEDRYHYAITGGEGEGEFANAALGVSHNGYVGLYAYTSVDNVWKFDFTEADAAGNGFWLRDKDGQRVARYMAPLAGIAYLPGLGVDFFNVAAGDVTRFELFDVRLLE